MAMVELATNISLPIEIVNGLNASNNRMICLLYSVNGENKKIDIGINRRQLEYLSKVVKDNSVNGYDFVLVSDNGKIYSSIKDFHDIKVDENEYIFIGNNLVVHSHETGYVVGEDINDVNDNYLREVKEGRHNISNNFGKNGFVKGVKVKRKIA